MRRIRFFSHPKPRFEFEPGDDVDIPDTVVRRWELLKELLELMELEMFEWKRIGCEQRESRAAQRMYALEIEALSRVRFVALEDLPAPPVLQHIGVSA